MRPAKRFAPRVVHTSTSSPPPSTERVSLIIDFICERYGLLLSEVKKHCRKRELCDARMVLYRTIRKYEPNATVNYLGALFNRNNSSISVALQCFNDLYDTNERLRIEVAEIGIRIDSLIKDKNNLKV